MILFKLTFWRREYLRQDELNNSEIRCHRDKPNVLNYSTPASRAPWRPANPPPTTNTRKDQMERWLIINNLFLNLNNITYKIHDLFGLAICLRLYLFLLLTPVRTRFNLINYLRFFKNWGYREIHWKNVPPIKAFTF